MRFLFHLLMVPFLIFVCALFALWLPLPRPFPPALSQSRNQIAALAAGILFFGNLLLLAGGMVSSRLQRNSGVDRAMLAMGLQGRPYMLFGRRYRGEIQGKAIDISFVRGRWGDSALNIYIQADLQTRIAIGNNRPLLDCRNCPQVIPDAPALSHLQIYAQDEQKARNWLAQAAVKDALLRLMDKDAAWGHRNIYLQPARLWFYAHPADINAAPFAAGINDLLALPAFTDY